MKPSEKYAVSVSVTGDGVGKVVVIDGKGNTVTVYVTHAEEYVAVDTYRNGEPMNSFDVNFVEGTE